MSSDNEFKIHTRGGEEGPPGGGGGGGMFGVNVSAGGLPEVCWRSVRGGYRARRFEVNVSAGGLPEVCQVRGTEDHQLLLPTQEEKYYSHTVG